MNQPCNNKTCPMYDINYNKSNCKHFYVEDITICKQYQPLNKPKYTHKQLMNEWFKFGSSIASKCKAFDENSINFRYYFNGGWRSFDDMQKAELVTIED